MTTQLGNKNCCIVQGKSKGFSFIDSHSNPVSGSGARCKITKELPMSLQKPPFGLKEKPLSDEAHNFDYAALDSKTLEVVQQRTSEIKERLRDTAQAIWEIGQKLVDVRNCLSYGEFNSWVKTEFQWSRSTAYNYINVFEKFSSCPNFGQLNIAASALYLLAASSIPDEARKEALESARVGETITYSKAKAIISRYKKSSQINKDEQSFTINVSAQPLERKSSTAAKPSPATTLHLDQPNEPAQTMNTNRDAVVGESVQQLGEEMPQLMVDDFEVRDRVCIPHSQNGEDKWAGKTAVEKLPSEQPVLATVAKREWKIGDYIKHPVWGIGNIAALLGDAGKATNIPEWMGMPINQDFPLIMWKESQKLSPVRSQELKWFSIEKETKSQLTLPVLPVPKSESIEQELSQKLEALNFTASSSQLLPNILQNYANPTENDFCSKVNPPPQPISMNTDDICILLQANVKYLTDEQIKVVWQAIAYRIRSESLALYNLSDSELKHLHKEAEQELNQRQYH